MILFFLKLHRAECILVTLAFCSDTKYGQYGYYTNLRAVSNPNSYSTPVKRQPFFFIYIILSLRKLICIRIRSNYIDLIASIRFQTFNLILFHWIRRILKITCIFKLIQHSWGGL